MDIVIRATVMFAILFALLRLMGKRELAQMTPFELVLLVVIGDLLEKAVTHHDTSVTGATLAILTFAFWALLLNFFANKSRRAEKLIDGEPSVVIENGKLIEGNLVRNRLTRSEVESEMRLAGIGRVAEVAWGILETNGKISFIEKSRSGPSSQSDNERGAIG
jgi:uncharacterized membrane protein YcaP (DUF421 family)